MMALRWIYFGMGSCGWIVMGFQVWHKMGWVYGLFFSAVVLLLASQWAEDLLLKQWKMKRIISYIDIERAGE